MNKFCLLLLLPLTLFSQTSNELFIFLGTHGGSTSAYPSGSHYNPSSPQTLKQLNVAGALDGALDGDTVGASVEGDLIELGFFNTNPGGTLSPNSDATDLFIGEWTPLTTLTSVGQDVSSSNTLDAGMYGFQITLDFSAETTQVNDPSESSSYQFTDNVGSLSSFLSKFDEAATDPRLGLRFYDKKPSLKASGVRYNTIMNANWVMPEKGNTMDMYLYDTSNPAALDSNLRFEFDNTDAYTANLAKVGTSHTRVENDDFVATVTYFNDSAAAVTLDLDASDIGSAVVSGFEGTNVGSKITGGDDGSILTIHSAAGNTGSDAFEFVGDIYESGSASSDLSIIKTGSGDQILSGNINLASGSGDKGYINLTAGGLTLNPGAGETQVIEYLKGASGTTLTLDNTGAETIELGFAQSQAGATFSGDVVLTGSGSSNTIKVASGSDTLDYGKEQVFGTGVISGSAKLVKSGVGRLKLSGDNTISGGVDINDGTVAAGHGDALGGSGNAVVINKGKLEVSSGITLANTSIQGGSGKSMIGGAGTFAADLTVGDQANEIDYISPGRGISSSLTPSMKGVDLDASTDAIGTLTVGDLNWNDGGVFDWQIKDFDPSTGTAGTQWDKLAFTSLDFETTGGSKFDINIMALKGSSFDGTQGLVSNNGNTWNDYTGTNGFLFASGGTISGLGGVTNGDVSTWFNIRADDYHYHTGHWYGDWGVYKQGGDLYLTYSVAPEPSTYIMVAGLLMLPGYNFIRRFRKSGDESKEA